ncbi:NADH:flavin oxidoreductase (plasmid) [Streptomyces sp. NBC_00503]|nr:NADH:flavin oxidoreductase [Streptomyces sp. NBC_00503]WUD86601.1 NADH:flavin oxidoreductase [Streptomyces sp. NBC_00503]
MRINGLTLDNRVAMAPMTREGSPGGVPGPDVAEYYARRARGGTGLIITEGTLVEHPSVTAPDGVPHFYGEDALAGWARVVAEVHRAGGRIVPQLWHTGIYRDTGFVPEAAPQVGPSGLDLAGERVGEPMSGDDIAEAVASLAEAAGEARRLGFDGIELHAAHGFLIDQFLWPQTNRRTDGYGGSPAARARFAAEVVAACRQVVGPHYPILFRFSQWKVTDYTARLAHSPEELGELLAPLTAAGVDAYHVSTRRFWLPEFEGSPLSLAAWTRKLTGKPTFAVGSVGLADSDFQDAFAGRTAASAPLTRVEEALERGDFDGVAVGRALLSDPEWAAKVRDGRTRDILPFDPVSLTSLI